MTSRQKRMKTSEMFYIFNFYLHPIYQYSHNVFTLIFFPFFPTKRRKKFFASSSSAENSSRKESEERNFWSRWQELCRKNYVIGSCATSSFNFFSLIFSFLDALWDFLFIFTPSFGRALYPLSIPFSFTNPHWNSVGFSSFF